jgi:CubicO group peptidase (beta-lactamase class C family)
MMWGGLRANSPGFYGQATALAADVASSPAPRYGPALMTVMQISHPTYPGLQWEHTTGHGWSPERLAQAQAYSERAGSTGVMIVQDGRVVAQWGDTARKSPIASVRKSLLSALYGIAVEEGKVRLDMTLAELGIDDKQPLTPEEKQATVADLLTTRSGVYHPVDSQPVGLAGSLPARGTHRPGTYFYYNNWDFNVLGTIYQQVTGEGIYESFKRRIADAIGLQDFVLSDGSWGTGEISRHRNYQFAMSARDLARFGLLYARGGRWNDKQVVPAHWVTESTRTRAVVRSQTFAGRGYGYMWWTGFGSDFSPTVTMPADVFHALGIGAQYLFVIPSRGIVIVHTVDMTRDKWPDIDNFQIGRLLWLILSAAGIQDIGPDTSPAARKTVLEDEALRAALAGKTLRFADAAMDGPYFIHLAVDGAATLTKGAERTLAHTGKWWIDGNLFCRGWDNFVPHHNCYPVGIDGATVSLYQDYDTMYLQAVIEPE